MGFLADSIEQGREHDSPKASWPTSVRYSSRAAFTLLEMIGVIAVIGILATAIAPNVVKAIDRAALKAEAQTLSALAQSLKAHLIETRTLPTVAAWATTLAAYADQNPAALRTNQRGENRVLLLDPATVPSERAIFLSSMRNGLRLPSAGIINTAAKFQSLWDTAEGAIPNSVSWNGWNTWNAVDGAGEYLLIQRANLKSIYLDELRTVTLAVNNTTSVPASYEVYDRNGSRLARSLIGASASITANNLAKGDRLLIYGDSSYSTLIYTYIVVGEDRSFDLSNWIASPGGGGGGGGGGSGNNGNGNNAGGNGKGNGNGKGKGN